LLLWFEPVIEGSIHSPHPVAHPLPYRYAILPLSDKPVSQA